MLERDAPYGQIIEHYRRLIAAGQLRDGDTLPSAREIAAEFDVSIATAAKVATGLQTLRLVPARPGGTVMTALGPQEDPGAGRPDRDHPGRPAQAGTESAVLEAATAEVPREVAAQLGTGPLAQVIPVPLGHPPRRSDRRRADPWHPASLAESCPALFGSRSTGGEVPGACPAEHALISLLALLLRHAVRQRAVEAADAGVDGRVDSLGVAVCQPAHTWCDTPTWSASAGGRCSSSAVPGACGGSGRLRYLRHADACVAGQKPARVCRADAVRPLGGARSPGSRS